MSSSKTLTWATPLPSANYRLQTTQQYNGASNQWTTTVSIGALRPGGFTLNGFGYVAGGVAHNPHPYRETVASEALADEREYSDVIYPFLETFYRLTGMCKPMDAFVVHSDTGPSRLVIELGHDRKPERMDDSDQC